MYSKYIKCTFVHEFPFAKDLNFPEAFTFVGIFMYFTNHLVKHKVESSLINLRHWKVSPCLF